MLKKNKWFVRVIWKEWVVREADVDVAFWAENSRSNQCVRIMREVCFSFTNKGSEVSWLGELHFLLGLFVHL